MLTGWAWGRGYLGSRVTSRVSVWATNWADGGAIYSGEEDEGRKTLGGWNPIWAILVGHVYFTSKQRWQASGWVYKFGVQGTVQAGD